MSLRNIVILAVAVLLAAMAVLDWILCIAFSRNGGRGEMQQDSEDHMQEFFLKNLSGDRKRKVTGYRV